MVSAGTLKAEIPFHYYNQNPSMRIYFDYSLENKETSYPSKKLIYFQTQEEKIEEFLNQTGVFQASSQENCKQTKHSIKACYREEIISNNTKIHLTLSCQLYKRRRKNKNKEYPK